MHIDDDGWLDAALREPSPNCDERPAQTPVRDVMSPEVVCCFEDQELAEATKVMEEKKIRRLPIVDREMRPVGMLSLGDVAKRGKDAQLAGSLLRKVLSTMNVVDTMEFLLEKLAETKSNQEFFDSMNQ